MIVTCVECGEGFDVLDKYEAEQWAYGHDCEPSSLDWDEVDRQYDRYKEDQVL